MTNPTLAAQLAVWAGFTLDSATEKLLGMRGLTLDANTGRTLALATEETEAQEHLYGAIDHLHTLYPGVFNRQWVSQAWVSGDHSITLPDGVHAILQVKFNGIQMAPLSRDDLARIEQTADEGGGVVSEETGVPAFYRTTGIADVDAGAAEGDRDWRIVLRLYPTPTSTDTVEVEYLSGPLAAAFAGDRLPLSTPLQRWAIYRAAETLGTDRRDRALLELVARERKEIEDSLYTWMEGMRDLPSRATTRQPHVTRRKRYRR